MKQNRVLSPFHEEFTQNHTADDVVRLWDIHTHIIPGVDHGSDSMDTTWSMVDYLYKHGVRGIFATPHSENYLNNMGNAHKQYLMMAAKLRESFPGLELRFGCEIYCDSLKVEETLDLLDADLLPTMKGRFVLVEFFPGLFPEEMLNCAEQFPKRGWIPIIAHVERYRYLVGCEDLVRRLRDLGCKLQLNLYSLEEYGPGHIRDWARLLIREQLIDYLGTDSHNHYICPPSIPGGMGYLSKNCTADYLERIAWKNAQDDLA